ENMLSNAEGTEFYDVRDPTVGNISLSAFGAGTQLVGNRTLTEYLGDKAYAAVIPGAGLNTTNRIVVGSKFFSTGGIEQRGILSHELLHITTGLGDYALAKKIADAYGVEMPSLVEWDTFASDWQANGCHAPTAR